MHTTILIVDDDAQIRRLCKITLQQQGYLISEATNGKEALAVMKAKPFDFIVLDLCMPDMDGIELLMALHSELPRPQIIVMSGFMEGAMLTAARHLGGVATLVKPFSPDELLLLIEQLMARPIQKYPAGGSH